MSSIASGHIYTGPWVDWSQGAILGSTLTLGSKTAPVFTAFLAVFITIIGACLWRILCFIIHQCSASERPRDGQHHQHQLIFRNTPSPTGAVRAFFESAFFWRKSSRHSFARALPLALFAVLFTLALMAGSILSSLVAKGAGSERLITSQDCGFFSYDNSSSLSVRTKAMTSRDLNDTIIASAYARQCYQGNHKLNTLQCSTYEKPALSYKVVANASCPFDKSMCKDNLVYQLDTGLIDTHKDLGINMPKSGRVGFRKVSTCAPITQQGFRTNHTTDGTDGLGLKGDDIVELHYGGIPAIDALSNTTYFYNTHAFVDGWGYELESITASPGGAGWVPIDEMARSDADISLIFLAPNSIKFYEANSDPFFSANFAADAGSTATMDLSYYISDNWVNVMGCTDQYQYCHPEDPSRCTDLTDYATAWTSIYDPQLGLNDVQQLVASRIALNSRALSIHHGISGRGASALRAQEYVTDRSQLEIKPNQWQIEVNSWFDIGLAKLQRAIVEYASGPDFLPEGTYLQKPDGIISTAMCGSQMVRVAGGTTSFSVLGISIIFSVGSLIVLVYLVLETVVAFLQRKMHWGDYRRVRWVMDDKLQVQRMAFEGAGMGGEWQNLAGVVPVTAGHEEFAGLEHVDPENPRWKTATMRQSWQQNPAMAQQMPAAFATDRDSSLSSLGEEGHVVKYDVASSPQLQHQHQHHQGYQQVQQHEQQQQWPLEQQYQTGTQPAPYERQMYQPAPSQGQ